jgi:hypothetical protein
MTRLFSTILLLSALSTSLAAQAPASPPPAAPQEATTPSAILKPALDNLQQTLTTLRPERWKTTGTISQETQANITSIQNDLLTTLPTLLAVADQHPNSVAQVLPAFRNIEALYDVVLRVSQVAILAAPTQQSTALLQTTAGLESSRRELADHLQSAALTQNQQIHDLQAQLHTLQSTPAPAPVVCPPPPAPAKKRKPRPKPASAPSTTPSTTPPPTAPAAH